MKILLTFAKSYCLEDHKQGNSLPMFHDTSLDQVRLGFDMSLSWEAIRRETTLGSLR